MRAPKSLPRESEPDVVRYAAKLRTPFAVLGVRTDGRAVTRITYLPLSERAQAPGDPVSVALAGEIERYLADPAHRFTVPLAPGGTPFQQRVWEALRAIPLGESRTYGEVARLVRSAPRAIGQACGANRIALVIPCHRVVGAQGALGGFMGTAGTASDEAASLAGQRSLPLADPRTPLRAPVQTADPIAIKRWLLQHEGYRFGA